MLKYRGNLKDQWLDFKCWGLNYLEIAGLVVSNPYRVVRALYQYPWIYDLLKVNNLVKRYNEGRNGTALHLSLISMHHVTKGLVRGLKYFVYDSKDIVLANCMIPSEIYQAMGLKWFMTEVHAAFLPILDHHSCDKYMDVIENEGLPGDTCSFPRITAGMFAAGHIPKDVKVVLSNNLPCEGGMTSYGYYEQELEAPIFRLDVPYDFKDEANLDILAEDMKEMIAFLEKETGRKMDWNELRVILERFNQVNELELERWEMNKTDTPPIANENIWLPHFWNFNIEPGTTHSLKWFQELQAVARKAYDNKEPPVKNMKFRAILWNPPTFAYGHFWNWLERCWGIACMNDMESFGHFENMYIDTSTNDSMMKGLARKWAFTTMARHTRGSAENYLQDIWHMVDIYQADLVIMANHIGCRSSISLSGVIKEGAQKHKVPFCFFDYEMMDSRICSRQGIRDQINNFMLNIMNATPLDEDLMVFDDDDEW